MYILQKSVRVNDEEIIDTSPNFSKVIAMQLTNMAMTVENLFNPLMPGGNKKVTHT